MDPLLEKLQSFDWPYADADDESYQEIKQRIATAGKKRQLLTYSQLVQGIEFQIPSVNDGQPFRMNTNGWTGLDRHIIGQFLGKLSCESYGQYGFMANALVVDAVESRPSKNFFDWMAYIEAIPDKSEKETLRFWAEQVQKAHKYYRKHG